MQGWELFSKGVVSLTNDDDSLQAQQPALCNILREWNILLSQYIDILTAEEDVEVQRDLLNFKLFKC